MSTRTITLTGRPPVRIQEDAWPLIASASEKEFEGEFDWQSFRTTKWFLGVRTAFSHEDARAVVYARYTHDTQWRSERSYSAARGVLIDSADPPRICEAVNEVAADIATAEHCSDHAERWRGLAHDCIADLPAVALD